VKFLFLFIGRYNFFITFAALRTKELLSRASLLSLMVPIDDLRCIAGQGQAGITFYGFPLYIIYYILMQDPGKKKLRSAMICFVSGFTAVGGLSAPACKGK
jgi:hypothetical protein